MNAVLCFGSLNIDYVYDVPHIVRPGETLAANERHIYCGGKGLNQAIALARAGIKTFHAGVVGEDGEMLLTILAESGVDTYFVEQIAGPSGHTVIQRDSRGENSIVLYGGSNQQVSSELVRRTLSAFSVGTYILLQNEINDLARLLIQAKERGLRIVLNPSPLDQNLLAAPLELVDLFILNELEAADILREQLPPQEAVVALSERYKNAQIVLTVGKEGAYYFDQSSPRVLHHGIYDVPVVDTTGAGDTFTGYFVATLAKGNSVEKALEQASLAAALAVSRPGAAPAIPYLHEVEAARLTLAE